MGRSAQTSPGKTCRFREIVWRLLLLVLLLSGCREEPPQALGTIEWDRISGRAPASEVIVEIPVKEGQRVDRGTLLVRFDDRKLVAKLSEVEARIRQVRWRLQELEAGPREQTIASARARLDAARATLNNNRDIYRRQESLYKSRVVSQESLDTLRSRYLSSQERVNELAESLAELLAGTRPETLEQVRAELDALRAEKERLELIRQDYRVVAHRPGLVDSLPFEVGDRPPVQAVVSVLLAGKTPWARVAVPAPKRSGLKVGAEYRLRVDGYPEPFFARLRRISSEAAFTPFYALSENDRNRLSYIAELDLLGDRAKTLSAGLPAQLLLEAP